jgi:hypothetical protein
MSWMWLRRRGMRSRKIDAVLCDEHSSAEVLWEKYLEETRVWLESRKWKVDRCSLS